METNDAGVKHYQLSFMGSGSTYFGITIVNWLLTIITLGIYYPWAKEKKLKYIYGSTALNEDRFAFHGTGKEMFKGFIKAILLFVVLFGLFYLFIYLQMPITALIVLYAGLFAIMPFAIHGSYRYRMSRTSWRGIRFGYRGNRTELLKLFLKGIFLTVITFGIYGSWFSMKLRNYLIGKVRFGNLELEYDGHGDEFFVLNLKGYLLTLVTLGIYSFWWERDLFAYYVDNTSVHNGEQHIEMKSTATGGGFFKLDIVNMLIVVFTLGFGYAWAVTRTMNFVANHIEMEGDIDLDSVVQTEENFNDATGDDISDMLDIDFIF